MLLVSVGIPPITLAGRYDVRTLSSDEARDAVGAYDLEHIESLIPSKDECAVINAALDIDLKPFTGSYTHDKTEVILAFTERGWYQVSFVPEGTKLNVPRRVYGNRNS